MIASSNIKKKQCTDLVVRTLEELVIWHGQDDGGVDDASDCERPQLPGIM